MLPPTLFSAYRQYKDDTDAVASWLASTAKAAGCAPDLLPVGNQQRKKHGRPKGKAREEARKNSSKASYLVPVKSFVPLAEHISASRNAVSVPASLFETLDRVIAVRSSFGGRLSESGVETKPAAEAKHSFFTGVLARVRDILGPMMPAAAAAHTDTVLLAGMEALDFAEPSPGLSPEPRVERPTAADGDVDEYKAEPQTSFGDAVVAFVMLLTDLGRIRAYIKWIWSNHYDVAAAAVATNTGLDLARHLMSDVLPLLDIHGGVWEFTHALYTTYCVEKGFGIDTLQSGDGMFNVETYDVAEKVMMVPFIPLQHFLNVIQPKAVPQIKEGMFGCYDPTRHRSTMSNGDKFQEDQMLLMESFTELMTIIRLIPGFPVQDEFLRGMADMDRTRAIPYYLVFAAQIFLDTNHLLRNEAAACCRHAFQQLSSMSDDLKLHLEFHENLRIDNWPASNDRILAAIQGEIKWILSDPILKEKHQQYAHQGMPVPDTMQLHRLLMRSPVLAGLLLFHFRAKMYDIGIRVANTWGSISYSNHLYNALQREGLLQGRWEDMDLAVALLGNESFFVGEPPSSRNEFLTRFCLQMGISAAALHTNPARRRRNVHKLASRAGPRGIKAGIPISSMFEDRYLRATEQVDWTPEQVDQVISRAEFEVEGSAEDGGFVLSKIDDPDKLREIRRAQRGKPRRTGAKETGEGARVAPDKLVQSLFLALLAETMEHAFPYLLLHRFSWQLLRSVKESCDPLLRSLYTPAYMERESELPFVVGYIFMTAAGPEQGSASGDGLLRQAAEAVNRMIDTGEGRKTMKFLRARGTPIEFRDEDGEKEKEGRSKQL